MSDIAGQAADAAAGVDSGVTDAALGQENVGGGDNTGSSEGGINPNWNTLLEKIPSGLHPMVIPQLKEWDTKFQEQLHQVQSQWDPYKDLVKDIPPETLQQALGFYRMTEQNPRAVYDQMREFYNFGDSGQGQEGQPADNQSPEVDLGEFDDITQNPKFQELLQNQEAMAQLLVGQYQQQEEARIEAQVEADMAKVLEGNPQFNNEQSQIMLYRIAAASGVTLLEAAEQLKGYVNEQVTASQRPAPQVMGGTSSSIPAAPATDPTKLSGQETRNLVADILRANQSQG